MLALGNTEEAIKVKCQEVESRTGMRLSWIRTAEELVGTLNNGLTEL